MGLYEDFMNMSGQNTQRDKKHKTAQLPQHRRQNYSIYASPVEQKSLIANAIQGMSSNSDGGLLGNREDEVNRQLAELNKQQGLGDVNSIVGITNQQGVSDINNTNNALASVMNTVNSGSKDGNYTSNSFAVGSLWESIVSGIESGGAQGYSTPAHKGSGAKGKYQIIPSTANAIISKNKLTNDFAWSPKGQDFMFNKHTEGNLNYLKSKGHNPDAFEMWMAQNLGMGNADKYLSGDGDKIGTKYISSNLPKGVKPTIENYVSHWKPKFAGI